MADKKKSIGQNQVTAQQGILLLTLLIIGVGAVFYFMYYAEMNDKLDKMRSESATIDAELVKLRKSKALMIETRQEAKRLEQRFEILRQKLPSTTDELNYFLSSISQRAQSAKVSKWELFRQEGLQPRGEVSAVPIRMEFIADFSGGNAFFWELSDMGNEGKIISKEQIVNVKSLIMTRENIQQKALTLDDAIPLKISCIAETYLYTGLPETGKGKKQKGKRGKK